MTTQAQLFPGSPPETEQVILQNDSALGLTPEGASHSLPLVEFIERLAPRVPTTLDQVLPDGIRAMVPGRGSCVVVHQSSPQPMSLRWVAADSDERVGPGTKYRTVRLALPYVWILALYRRRGDRMVLSGANECFFSNEPLRCLDQEPCFPALLNCSRFKDGMPKPLSWICTQHLDFNRLMTELPAERSISDGMAALREHLFAAAFNESSEQHELSSWFKETVEAKVDPRLASVEAWEQATAADPLFALEVPWLKTGQSLRAIAERGLKLESGAVRPLTTARDVLRLLLRRERSK
jgi:hypothetical protein